MSQWLQSLLERGCAGRDQSVSVFLRHLWIPNHGSWITDHDDDHGSDDQIAFAMEETLTTRIACLSVYLSICRC